MTCIIAHRDGWMVADRRETFEGSLLGPYRTNKIKRGRGLLVASSGNGVFQDLIEEALENEGVESQLRAVVRVFREKGTEIGGHALALSAHGICEITSRGSLCWLTSDYWAIGSGYQFALGYLKGRTAAGTCLVDTALASDAIEFAATFVNDVGDGVQVEVLR